MYQNKGLTMTFSRQDFNDLMFPTYVPMDMVIKSAHGCDVLDNEGRHYLDLTAGIAVLCLGHTPKGVQKIIKKQSHKLLHCSNIFTNESTLGLAAKLLPRAGFERVFFVNSGTEANEAALKLARRVAFDDFGADKNEIISFSHSFHGRTFFSVCVAGQDQYSDGFGPKPGAITHLPFNDIETFEKQISSKTCAVILEPVQGEGGIIPADPHFLKRVRELCDEHKALLIFDEVQTGIGRCGTFLCYEQYGIKPDLVTVAKGLGAGLPIGAVMTSKLIASHFGPGTHGSTFGGNPLACAVGQHVVDKVGDEEFLAEVREKGAFFSSELLKIGKAHGIISSVRGRGLLIGAELNDAYKPRAAEIQKLCFEHGLLILLAGHDVLRFAPALNISLRKLAMGLEILDEVFTEL